MPCLWPTVTMKPLATFVSDIHLSLHPPACRMEEDWLSVQKRYLGQLKEISEGSPIFIAGDLFDRWNPPPEVLHFALRELPENCFAVPGQHDLLNHRLDQMHRSGYGVLVAAGKIQDLSGGKEEVVEGRFRVRGYGWGEEIRPPSNGLPVCLLAHRYIWKEGRSHPGASPENHYSQMNLSGYRWAVFGDNHKGFVIRLKFGSLVICNSGTFIRRKSDEVDLQPAVHVIDSKLQFKSYLLDTSEDKIREVAETEEESHPLNLDAFISSLEGLGEAGLNFREAVEMYVKNHPELPSGVVEMLLHSLSHHENLD